MLWIRTKIKHIKKKAIIKPEFLNEIQQQCNNYKNINLAHYKNICDKNKEFETRALNIKIITAVTLYKEYLLKKSMQNNNNNLNDIQLKNICEKLRDDSKYAYSKKCNEIIKENKLHYNVFNADILENLLHDQSFANHNSIKIKKKMLKRLLILL